jgi:hypothetical protein
LVNLELAKAALAMPMAFIEVAGAFTLVGVLSIVVGRNMFVDADGRWRGGYVPATLRSYPFRLLRREGTEEMVLCIDEASVLDSDGAGHSLFDDAGNLSPSVKEAATFLRQIEHARKATEIAVRALVDADAIGPWDLQVDTGNERKKVKGLYRIDEHKLNALADDKILMLRKAGAIPLAYAQLVSLGQVLVLERLARMHAQPAQANPGSRPESLDQIFGRDSEQTLNFEALSSARSDS